MNNNKSIGRASPNSYLHSLNLGGPPKKDEAEKALSELRTLGERIKSEHE